MHHVEDNLVRIAVALHLDASLDSVHSEDHLERDLGLDPLDLVLVVLRLDELVGAQCALADLQGLETVADLEEMVRGWQSPRQSERVPASIREPFERRYASRTESGTLPIAGPLPRVRAAG